MNNTFVLLAVNIVVCFHVRSLAASAYVACKGTQAKQTVAAVHAARILFDASIGA
jgi:hypothetical protein